MRLTLLTAVTADMDVVLTIIVAKDVTRSDRCRELRARTQKPVVVIHRPEQRPD
jgi:hypothetical protein